MIKILFISCLIVFLLTESFFAQQITFEKEDLNFTVKDGYFYVGGSYFVGCNNTNGKKILFYPFPIDSLYGLADSLIIMDMTHNKIIEPLRMTEKGALFDFLCDSLQITELHISYRQKLFSNQAEYILETTAAWGAPLKSAKYQFIIPDDLQIEFFSIKPDNHFEADNTIIYYWDKTNYMPDRNFVIRFK